MRRFLILATVILGVSACSEIDSSSTTTSDGITNGDGKLTAGVGDAILEVVERESLPNAFGKADIFGRTRPTGTTSVYYAGVSNGDAIFVRRDVEILSSKTTMNSSPVIVSPRTVSNYSGTIDGRGFSGQSTTVTAPIFLPPNTPQDLISGVRETGISASTLPPNNSFVAAGQKVTVVYADANQVRYILND